MADLVLTATYIPYHSTAQGNTWESKPATYKTKVAASNMLVRYSGRPFDHQASSPGPRNEWPSCAAPPPSRINVISFVSHRYHLKESSMAGNYQHASSEHDSDGTALIAPHFPSALSRWDLRHAACDSELPGSRSDDDDDDADVG